MMHVLGFVSIIIMLVAKLLLDFEQTFTKQ